jgi:hypothetical protein
MVAVVPTGERAADVSQVETWESFTASDHRHSLLVRGRDLQSHHRS